MTPALIPGDRISCGKVRLEGGFQPDILSSGAEIGRAQQIDQKQLHRNHPLVKLLVDQPPGSGRSP